MKYKDCMIAYNPGGDIVVGEHPDTTGWSSKYLFTVGSTFLKAKTASDESNLIQMLLEFHHAVVRDRVSAEKAHRAFWEIDEYREIMAEDVPVPAGVG